MIQIFISVTSLVHELAKLHQDSADMHDVQLSPSDLIACF